MESEKIIVKHVLDHHYFGNGLYGLQFDEKIIQNFTIEKILDYFFNGLGEVISVRDKNDFNSLLQFFNIIPDDVKDFLVKYIFTLEYFYKHLSKNDFKTFLEKVNEEYNDLSKKYDAY